MNSINAEEASLSNASIGPKPLHRTTVARRAQGKIVSRAAYRESMSLLSTQQQLTLVNEINRLTDIGLPPTPAMVANFAADICKKKPGKNWVYEFTKKYEKNLKSAYLTAADLRASALSWSTLAWSNSFCLANLALMRLFFPVLHGSRLGKAF
jgi:hypothetical protein